MPTGPVHRGSAALRDVLPLIEVPTLPLYGHADRRSPLSVAEDLHAKIPTSKLVVMPGVGHSSNLELPETFNTEVRSFLQSEEGDHILEVAGPGSR